MRVFPFTRTAAGHDGAGGKVRTLIPLGMAATLALCTSPQALRVFAHAPERPQPGTRYIFYLHGRIVEDQGPVAVSPEFGPYEYAEIVQQLADSGFAIISEARGPDTDPELYADSVAAQVHHLLAGGIPPRDITVMGASKGSVIAMLVSSRLAAPVRYVLLANCNDHIFRRFSLQLHGDVLSVYEASDPLGQTCRPLFEQSPELGQRREVRLETGLGHGFIFRPLEVWVRPALAWARNDT